jgi:predicted nucleotidyltransferase
MIRFKQIPKDIHSKIGVLCGFLSDNPDIIFAYLFGGLAKYKPNPLSDVDIAVYVNDVKKLDYLSLFSEITDILGTDEVDLVILNDASISLAGRILQNKKILVDKKPFLRHEYESLTLRKFFDFTVKETDILHRRYGIG